MARTKEYIWHSGEPEIKATVKVTGRVRTDVFEDCYTVKVSSGGQVWGIYSKWRTRATSRLKARRIGIRAATARMQVSRRTAAM